MKLYILASGKDKKGTQLEYLTKIILESLGYEYVSTNHISVGGDEIDVYAKRVFQSVGKMIEYPLVCECKAHEAPITMNDWLKFQGKVHKQKNNNSATQGLMIALSDANGNVKGDYEQTKYDDIQLIQGNDLIQPLSKAFSLETEDIAREEVFHLTNKTVISVDLVLFEKEIYWLFTFANNEYSIFDKNYKSLPSQTEQSLIPLIEKYTPLPAFSYRNVYKEFDLIRRRAYVTAVISWHLMKGKMTFQDAIFDVVNMTRAGIVPEMKDVEDVMQTIPFANVDVQNQTATLKKDEEIDYIKFYQFLLAGPTPIPLFLYEDYYKEHIDDELLEKILKIQHNLTLSVDDKKSCLFILRHSPSALLYAMMPDKMLKAAMMIDSEEEKSKACDYFMGKLLSHLETDVNGNMSEMTFEKLGLRDFNKSVTVGLVDYEGEKHKINTNERLFVKLLPEENNNIAYFRAFGNFDKEYSEVFDF